MNDMNFINHDKIPIKTNSITDDYTVYWNNKLGTGVSGPVRLCKKRSTNEQFAVKCLADMPRSRTEVRLHWLCGGHPNIVDIYRIYANDVQFPHEHKPRARLLVVMEVMEGGELFDRISKERYFTEKKAANYMRQIGQCLKRCHSLNVAHRDVKPENLLLKDDREDAEVKLSDFGFAKIDDGHMSTPQFTPYYVAPEVLVAQQLEDQRKLGIMSSAASTFSYDKSCDMWSAGVILYIMLCGYPPFYSETPSRQITETMKIKIMSGEYEFPEDDWLTISADAKDVVRRLLHVEPSQRMSIEDLLNHPWLVDAPDTTLRSPSIISNKDEFEDTKMAHSAQLTALRTPDMTIILKPMHQVNNRIIRKRMYRNRSSHTEAMLEEPPNKQSTTDEDRLQYLRDIIAYCVAPEKADDNEQTLNLLIKKAALGAEDNKEFTATLARWHWDGEKFNEPVDICEVADSLSYLLQYLSVGEGTVFQSSQTPSEIYREPETEQYDDVDHYANDADRSLEHEVTHPVDT